MVRRQAAFSTPPVAARQSRRLRPQHRGSTQTICLRARTCPSAFEGVDADALVWAIDPFRFFNDAAANRMQHPRGSVLSPAGTSGARARQLAVRQTLGADNKIATPWLPYRPRPRQSRNTFYPAAIVRIYRQITESNLKSTGAELRHPNICCPDNSRAVATSEIARLPCGLATIVQVANIHNYILKVANYQRRKVS